MKLIFSILILAFVFSCGSDTVHTKYVPIPDGGTTTDPGTQPPAPGGGDTAPSYQETVALLTTYCQKCHVNAAFMKSEVGLIASAAKNRVWNKSMPPDQSSLPDPERRKILAFFQ